MKWIVLALPLAGCATTSPEPKVVTQIVERPVAVSCVPANLPPAPNFKVTAQSLTAAADAGARELLLAAGFLERDDRLKVVEPVIIGCRKADQP